MKKIAVTLVSLFVAGGSFAATWSEEVKINVWPMTGDSRASATCLVSADAGTGKVNLNVEARVGLVIGSTAFSCGLANIGGTSWIDSKTTPIRALRIRVMQSATGVAFAGTSSSAATARFVGSFVCAGSIFNQANASWIPVKLSSTTGTSIWVTSTDDSGVAYIEYLR